LGLNPATLYDPQADYRDARSTYSDWNGGPKAAPSATHTVDTPPQTGAITGN
jgi:outer membrane protein